ncbi:hypothetical protein R1sor_020618 [Riccia sorocarpa]|uniref:Transposase n=1 Tax=Riccia sorocarpa TaxID=122646 RepID=A0ABD3GHK4_9MARC
MVNYTNRVMTALESAMVHEIAWPNRQERAVNSAHFAELGFLGCIGLVDGTLVKLSQQPRDDGETYFDRKMPSSCHDLTCLRRSSLWGRLGSTQYFDNGQYLLGTADISLWIALCARTREPVATWTRLISIPVLLMRE